MGDVAAPDRQLLTRQFFDRLDDFKVSTSELTRQEINRTPDPQRRREMLLLLDRLTLHPITAEAEELSRRYLEGGVFPHSVPEDALHVAVAVLNGQDVLASWNFKHLVNQRRRAAVKTLNSALGLPTIEILAPPEL